MTKLLSIMNIMLISWSSFNGVYADNQTATLSPIAAQDGLPFSIQIDQTPLELPHGFHSGVFGVFNGLWVFLAGSTIGLHGFGADPFPPEAQNTVIYVVDYSKNAIYSRSLYDSSSGLSQQQIDSLSVISPQFYQSNNTLYMTGGYGIDTATNTFGTKPTLTALYLPGVIQWVMQGSRSGQHLVQHIRQLNHSIFQICGGEMYPLNGISNLVFGQNFIGVYTDSSNGIYSEQIRRFKILDVDGQLGVHIYDSLPQIPDPNYRRRDLNILPTLLTVNNRLQPGLVAYSGVFTITTGVWTVPVVINENGQPLMADPDASSTFKQGMNHYSSAAASFYSKKYQSTYHLLLGGISYGYYENGSFQTDSEIPFINQVTTIKMDKQGHFTQYLMNDQYPVILSTESNPGNPLLFGAGAYFVPRTISSYANGVINFDHIQKPTVVGYIVGGIASTLPNTNVISDAFASKYIFKVTLLPKNPQLDKE